MKKTGILLLTMFCLRFLSYAQNWEELGVGLNSEGLTAQVFCMTSNVTGLYVGGAFTNISGKNYVARWDGNGWFELGGSGQTLDAVGSIYCLVSDLQGNIYAAGDFKNAAGYFYVAKWDGSNWSELEGFNKIEADHPIFSLSTDPAGNIYAGGNFRNNSGHAFVAKWDGNKWSELGSGNMALKANNTINSILTDQKGNVYAAGSFTNNSGYNYLAIWNGSSWNEIGNLNANAPIKTITFDRTGNLLAGGHFTKANRKKYIAKWNGNVWSELGSVSSSIDANDFIGSIVSDNDSNIYAGGAFINSNGKKMIMKWDGKIWEEQNFMITNAGNRNIPFLHCDIKGAVYTSQTISTLNSLYYISVFYNGRWQTLGRNLGNLNATGGFYCLAKDKTGNIYTSSVARDNVTSTFYISKFNGTEWVELSNNKSSLKANNVVFTIASDSLGNIYAGGAFTNSFGENMVAKWDGKKWSELGRLKANGNIRVIVTDSKNHVYAAGEFKNASGSYFIAHWDGVSWKEFSSPGQGFNGAIYCMMNDADTLYAGGAFLNTDGYRYVARWNGNSWSELGDGNRRLRANGGDIYQIIMDGSKQLYTAGSFYEGGGTSAMRFNVFKWNGKTWSNFGNLDAGNYIKALACDASGKIYAGGNFWAKTTFNYVAVWNGVKWEGPDDGDKMEPLLDNINAMILDKEGHLLCAGNFTNASGYRYIAVWKNKKWGEIGPEIAKRNIFDNGTIHCVKKNKEYVFAAGELKNATGKYYVGAWDGLKWNELKNDSSDLVADSFIYSMTCDQKGNLYVGGAFRNKSGKPYVAMWDGVKWSELGSGANALNPDGTIQSIVADRNGKIYAAGKFRNLSGYYYVAVWDGISWNELGPGSLNANGEILVMTMNSKDELYIGGNFRNTFGTYISRYIAGSWQPLAEDKPISTSFVPIRAMVADDEGNVYVAGSFRKDYLYQMVVKWDGKELLEIKNGPHIDFMIYAIEVDFAGNIYVAANVNNSSPANIFKCDGKTWKAMDNAGKYAPKNKEIYTLLVDELDHIYAAGSFINELGKTYVAKWSESNPTGIKPIVDIPSGSLSVYPNPVSGLLFLECEEGITGIQVYNQLGQEVISSEAISEMDVSSLVPGIYIVRAKTMNGDWLNAKFIRI